MTELFNIAGWISAVCLAGCGLPLMIDTIRQGRVGTDPIFLKVWFLGEITGLLYSISLGSYSLIFNYILNTVFLVVILRYYLFPRKEKRR